MKFERYVCKSGVLFFLSIPPPFGGGEIVNQFLLERIKDKFGIITLSRDSHSKSVQGRLTFRNVIEGMWAILYQALVIVRLRPRVVFLGIPKDYFSFVRQSAIVHFAKMFGSRVIGDLHGMNFTFSAASSLYYHYTINKFHRIRVLGAEIGEGIRSTGFKNEISVIDNGIDVPGSVQYHALFSPGETMRLLYFGAISELKGFSKFLAVFKRLQHLYPGQVEAHIAGEFADKASRMHFEELVADKNIKTQVNYHQRVLGDQKWKLLTTCTLLLHYSSFDGQPLTIIEAMACGVPTIATKVGAIPEMITHMGNGFLVDDYLTDTVDIVSGLLNGRIKYGPISANARIVFQKRFTLDKYVDNIQNLIVN